jgi:thiamine pyrophosphate-dependent acetolactate synthase large subunit-like protein
MSRNMLNGAQVIVDYLIQEKVPQVFGLCGHGNIQFIDALYTPIRAAMPEEARRDMLAKTAAALPVGASVRLRTSRGKS